MCDDVTECDGWVVVPNRRLIARYAAALCVLVLLASILAGCRGLLGLGVSCSR